MNYIDELLQNKCGVKETPSEITFLGNMITREGVKSPDTEIASQALTNAVKAFASAMDKLQEE